MAPRVPYTWRQPDFPGDGSDVQWLEPSLLVICQDADVEAAIPALLKTLKQPFAPRLVASVFVHETMRKKFCDLVKGHMEPMHKQAAGHAHYQKAVRMVECLQAEVVSLLQPDDIGFRFKMAPGSPVIVCEFDQSFFGGRSPTSVVTLHTFRHAHELPALLARERVPFASAAVWGFKMAGLYEAALKLNLDVVYINCDAVPLVAIMEYFKAKVPHVILAHYHHFEVLQYEGRHRIIVFPAAVFCHPPKALTPEKGAGDALEEGGKAKGKPGHGKK